MQEEINIGEQHNTPVLWDAGGELYFRFEEDFIEDNVRCIPMIVRFKLDACGIKLKLEEWCRLSVEERNTLVYKSCTQQHDILQYRIYLQQLVLQKTGSPVTNLTIDQNPAWADKTKVFDVLVPKAAKLGMAIPVNWWAALTNLQRFALVKLSRQSHESKNLPKALKEFGLV